MRTQLVGEAERILTSDISLGGLSALGSTTDQLNGDCLASILGNGIPGDIEGRAGVNNLVRLGLGDRIEVGSRVGGKDRGGHGQDGRDGQREAHLGWCCEDKIIIMNEVVFRDRERASVFKKENERLLVKVSDKRVTDCRLVK